MLVRVPVSIGELLDKIVILEIKQSRMTDPDQRANVSRELSELTRVWEEAVPDPEGRVEEIRRDLREVNESLWEVEDALREKEARSDFGDEFMELARAVYRTNDRRSALKRELNERLGSTLTEEKLHPDYASSGETEDGGGRGLSAG